ncbi:hypothetical protein MTO96_031058 [Rhipicephalus appendiculatus]
MAPGVFLNKSGGWSTGADDSRQMSARSSKGIDIAVIHFYMRRSLLGLGDQGGGMKMRFEDVLLLLRPNGLVQSPLQFTPDPAEQQLAAAAATPSLGTGHCDTLLGHRLPRHRISVPRRSDTFLGTGRCDMLLDP